TNASDAPTAAPISSPKAQAPMHGRRTPAEGKRAADGAVTGSRGRERGSWPPVAEDCPMSRRFVSSARADVYTRVTAEIISAVEAGPGEGRLPWNHDGTSTARPTNAATGKPYRGINTLVLWAATSQAGYTQGLWGTYRSWQAAGAQVRRGERATTVVPCWRGCSGHWTVRT